MIPPGKTEAVTVMIPTSNRRGELLRRVTVTTNDRANISAQLECLAKVLSAVKCEPDLIAFGQIERDAPEQVQTVTISRGDGGPLHPKVVSTSGNTEAETELKELEPGEKYELRVAIKPPWPNNAIRGNITLETGVEQAKFQEIAYYASIPPRLQAEPARLMVRPDPEREARSIATLRWSGGPPGKVTEVTVSDPQVKAAVQESEGNQIVVIDVPAGYRPTQRAGNIVTVLTDDPAVPSISIPIYVVNAAGRTMPAGGAPAARPRTQAPASKPPAPEAGKPASRAED